MTKTINLKLNLSVADFYTAKFQIIILNLLYNIFYTIFFGKEKVFSEEGYEKTRFMQPFYFSFALSL
jgi:hypothetical protein